MVLSLRGTQGCPRFSSRFWFPCLTSTPLALAVPLALLSCPCPALILALSYSKEAQQSKSCFGYCHKMFFCPMPKYSPDEPAPEAEGEEQLCPGP